MVTASDLITYIGVPLTVAGVLPLLWNMFLALHIWIRLKRSVPLEFRKYYSYIVDPAAGKVTVVARMPVLSLPGLWATSDEMVGLENSSTYTQRVRQRSLAGGPAVNISIPQFTSIAAIMGPTIKDSPPPTIEDAAPSLRLAPKKAPKLLQRNWMLVALELKLFFREPQEDDATDEARFTVESDMKASDVTPLGMNWDQFVWFALALGTSPYDPAWSSATGTLKTWEGKDIAYIYHDAANNRIYAKLYLDQRIFYSLRAALAWHNIAVENNTLLPLGKGVNSRVKISSVQIHSGLSVSQSPMQQTPGNASEIGGLECGECAEPLAAACSWILYQRTRPGDFIPVTERTLEFRQRQLCYLSSLDERGELEGRIRSLMRDGPYVTPIIEAKGSGMMAGQPSRQRPEDISDSPQDVDRGDTQTTDVRIPTMPTLNDCDRTTDTKLPTLEPERSYACDPLQAKANTVSDQPKGSASEKASMLLLHLRLMFDTSAYVRHYSKLSQIARAYRLYETYHERGILRELQGQFDLQIPNEKGKMRAAMKKHDCYEWIPASRRAEFETAVKDSISGSASSNVDWKKSAGEMRLLGCIALAVADWNDCPTQPWHLHEDLMLINGEAIYARDERVKSLEYYEGMLLRILDHEDGLYVAPESPLPELLQQQKRCVYLL